MRRLILPLLATAVLGGCVGQRIDAPSLTLRDVEKQPIAMPDEASEPQTALDPALGQRIAKIEAGAQAGHASFETSRTRTATAVAKAANAPAGSESWTVAQQELSVLDATRGAVQHAAAELDLLRNEPANAAFGNRHAIEAAAERLNTLVQSETEAVAALSAKLKT